MNRKPLYVACFTLLILAACSSQPAATATTPVLHTVAPDTATPEVGCSAVKVSPTAAVAQALPAITASDYVRGPDAAAVTLLAYCDFQSAQCEVFNRVLDQLQKNHPNDLRVVLRPFPVPMSLVAALDKSELSVQAAIAAGNQGKFWEMRDLLHGQYSTWTPLSAGAFQAWVVAQSGSLGLDGKQFQRDLTSAETVAKAKSMYSSATTVGIAALPTVFINGSLQQRAGLSYEGLDSTIGLVSLGSREFKTCPPFNIDTARQYTATLHTAKGDITMRLFPDKAPLAVNSFVFLARQGWFNGTTFHRVIPGYIAQAGDPSGTGAGGPGYYFKNEVREDLTFDKPGMVGMANAGPDTNGSQFFITYAPEPKLDGSYTVFAQVIQGMDVVESLTARDTQVTPGLPPGDQIISVSIQEK